MVKWWNLSCTKAKAMILCNCRGITESEAETMTTEEFTADLQCGMCLEHFIQINN